MTRHGDPFGGRAKRTGCGCGPEFLVLAIFLLLACTLSVYLIITNDAWDRLLP